MVSTYFYNEPPLCRPPRLPLIGSFQQKCFELSNSLAAVADSIFFAYGHLCESPVVAPGHENGVITKASGTFFLKRDLPVSYTFKSKFPTADNEGDDRSEAGVPVILTLEVAEQEVHIGLSIISRAGIAGRIDAWSAIEGFDFQAGIL